MQEKQLWTLSTRAIPRSRPLRSSSYTGFLIWIHFFLALAKKSFWPLTTVKTLTLDQVACDGKEPRDSSGAVGKARSSGVWEGLDVTRAYLLGFLPPHALPLPPAFPTAQVRRALRGPDRLFANVLFPSKEPQRD